MFIKIEFHLLIYCPVTHMSFFNVIQSALVLNILNITTLSKLFCPFCRSFTNLLKSTILCGIQLVTSLHC